MVTVEAALVFPTVVVLLAVALWTLAAAWAHLRCTAAASAAAAAADAGAPAAVVAAVAARDAPPGATVRIQETPRFLTVWVVVTVRPFGGVLRRLPGITVSDHESVWAGGGGLSGLAGSPGSRRNLGAPIVVSSIDRCRPLRSPADDAEFRAFPAPGAATGGLRVVG
ncbi:MAG TPA: TadE family type IV pilus minor pilin [Mycobacteriales bacterium]|nr:TadE family type IV pilus minor pilin [Mycobacteriales bacterium]